MIYQGGEGMNISNIFIDQRGAATCIQTINVINPGTAII